METAVATPAASVIDLEAQYLFQNYARYPLVLHRGKGCYVYDTSGKRYLDLIAGIGVNALGHAHPRLMKVIREQAGRLLHTSNLYYHEYQGPLAERIAKVSGLDRVFFCNSGTEAMEGALKIIRAHGTQDQPAQVRDRGAGRFLPRPDVRRALHHRPGEVSQRFRADAAGRAIRSSQRHRRAGTSGWREHGRHRYRDCAGRGRRQSADRRIHSRGARAGGSSQRAAGVRRDPVRRGAAREHISHINCWIPIVMPDITTAAKPLACGIPLGFVAANERAASAIGKGKHGTTFGGGPLACRVALEFFDILDELLPNIIHVGGYFRMQLMELAKKFSFIQEVRGYGLMIGVELEFSRQADRAGCMEQGLLINCTHDKVLRVLPPYILTEQEVDRAVTVLKRVFKKAKPPDGRA